VADFKFRYSLRIDVVIRLKNASEAYVRLRVPQLITFEPINRRLLSSVGKS
jgi:hypothetical protein